MWGEGSTGAGPLLLQCGQCAWAVHLGTRGLPYLFQARAWRNDLRSSVKVARKETSFQSRCSQIKSSFINPQSSPVHSVTFQKRGGLWEVY